FFFQAEDGIRDRNVTGVQTCALPISPRSNALGGNHPEQTIKHTSSYRRTRHTGVGRGTIRYSPPASVSPTARLLRHAARRASWSCCVGTRQHLFYGDDSTGIALQEP